MFNTEHIFQIAISVDDDAIKNSAIRSATTNLAKYIDDAYFSSSYSGRRQPTQAMTDIVEKYVTDMLAKHEQEIIDAVINRLTEKLARSKTVKEKLEEISV